MDETKKGFMQNIGDLSFKKIDETNYEFSIKVEEKFLNTGKIAHGGFIATDQYLNELKVLGIIIILSAVIFSQLAPIYGKKIYG